MTKCQRLFTALKTVLALIFILGWFSLHGQKAFKSKEALVKNICERFITFDTTGLCKEYPLHIERLILQQESIGTNDSTLLKLLEQNLSGKTVFLPVFKKAILNSDRYLKKLEYNRRKHRIESVKFESLKNYFLSERFEFYNATITMSDGKLTLEVAIEQILKYDNHFYWIETTTSPVSLVNTRK